MFNFIRLRKEVLKEKDNIDDGIGIPGKKFSDVLNILNIFLL